MPLTDKIEVEVYRRKLTLELEEITELEAHALAQDVSEKMEALSHESGIVDSSKLATLTALQYAAELSRAKNQEMTHREMAKSSVEDMIRRLRAALKE